MKRKNPDEIFDLYGIICKTRLQIINIAGIKSFCRNISCVTDNATAIRTKIKNTTLKRHRAILETAPPALST